MTGRKPLSAKGKVIPSCTLALTNMEVAVQGWFEMDVEGSAYNDFIKAMLLNDVDYMYEFMNEIALKSFSNFDVTKKRIM